MFWKVKKTYFLSYPCACEDKLHKGKNNNLQANTCRLSVLKAAKRRLPEETFLLWTILGIMSLRKVHFIQSYLLFRSIHCIATWNLHKPMSALLPRFDILLNDRQY